MTNKTQKVIEEAKELLSKISPWPWFSKIEPNQDSCMGAWVYEVRETSDAKIFPLLTAYNYRKAAEELAANAECIAQVPEIIQYILEQIKGRDNGLNLS